MASSLILDSCLLALFCVGSTSKNYIAKHKRLQGYDEIDFDNICEIIANSEKVVFTPNVLTETSNLVRYLNNPIRSEVAQKLKAIIGNADEIIVGSQAATLRQEYIRLGLTDAALLELARGGCTILTVDLDLYLAALKDNLNAINYFHIKDQRADFR